MTEQGSRGGKPLRSGRARSAWPASLGAASVLLAAAVLALVLSPPGWGPAGPAPARAQAEPPVDLFASVEAVLGLDQANVDGSQQLALEGDLLFWHHSGRLAIYDTGGSADGSLLAEIPVGHQLSDLARVGDTLALLPRGVARILRFDISDPSAPVALPPLETRQAHTHLAVDGDMLFAIGAAAGGSAVALLDRFDLGDPLAPTMSSYQLPDMVTVYDLAADESWLAVAASAPPGERVPEAEVSVFALTADFRLTGDHRLPVDLECQSAPPVFTCPSRFVRLGIEDSQLMLRDFSGIRLYALGAGGPIGPTTSLPLRPAQGDGGWTHLSGDRLQVLRPITGPAEPRVFRAEVYVLAEAGPSLIGQLDFAERPEQQAQGFVLGADRVCETTRLYPPLPPDCWDLGEPGDPRRLPSPQRDFEVDRVGSPACVEHAAFLGDEILFACGSSVLRLSPAADAPDGGRLSAVDRIELDSAGPVHALQVADGAAFLLGRSPGGNPWERGLYALDTRADALAISAVATSFEPQRIFALADHLLLLHADGLAVMEPVSRTILASLAGEGLVTDDANYRIDGARLYLRGPDDLGAYPPPEETADAAWIAIDLTDPMQPRIETDAYRFDQNGRKTLLQAFFGGFAYSRSEPDPPPGEAGDIVLGIHDISGSASQLIAEQTLSRTLPHRGLSDFGQALAGGRLHLGLAKPFVARLDLSDPGQPRRLADMGLPGRAFPLIEDPRDRMLVLGPHGELSALDPTASEEPGLAARWFPSGPGIFRSVARQSEGLMTVETGSIERSGGQLRVERLYDLRAGGRPRYRFSMPRAQDWAHAGERLFLIPADSASVEIYDLSQAGAPSLIGLWCLGDGGCPPGEGWQTQVFERLILDGDTAWIFTRNKTLLGLDVSDPLHPRERSRLELPSTPGLVEHIPAAGRLLVYGYAGEPQQMVDVSDPDAPRLSIVLDRESYGTRFEASGLTLVTLHRDRIELYDLGEPEAPRLLSSLAYQSERWPELLVQGDRAYLALDARSSTAAEARILVLDIGAPAAPTVIGQLRLPFAALLDLLPDGRLAVAPPGSAPSYGRILGAIQPWQRPEPSSGSPSPTPSQTPSATPPPTETARPTASATTAPSPIPSDPPPTTAPVEPTATLAPAATPTEAPASPTASPSATATRREILLPLLLTRRR